LSVMLAVLSFAVLGDALRDFRDPRSRIEVGLGDETSSARWLSNSLYLVLLSQACSFARERACRVEGSLPSRCALGASSFSVPRQGDSERLQPTLPWLVVGRGVGVGVSQSASLRTGYGCQLA